ncbi:MAG TPA: CRISPR system precrRNA processing endoribonuclease RAMP protein Cas6 [Chloroflexus aurantiacus]|jgi:hypothetical protein|uniref:CRISPR-associated protein Cas6 C-terminal domain-containing protein n=1 Tax=Chloroflexus aurantiacus (strain ATCC 29366 / DSM 635 / J-10-fl) TaxID=324602 RepID=A9WJU8_CHLAA|nr:CRISPR system precrRNA processing endoribonuclease RAMP protein Cas6 [Chloroflexus aurantiacus]ABY36564.1 conserved hypothetical protein [Chloroflexus aurantiacus J-10-fl]GIV94566.1 MAG: hypothetical protein KatS3mg056_3275 [Chloroflexus sp.]HBW67992.1 CRISPR system precrRNA processing endoribonuclease RAMP protein Cas6 [Chloroflexus aurantiacus]
MKDQFCLPALSVLRLRISLRLASAARLPAFKGALFRGALGYALQRIGCPPVCWGHGSTCPAAIPLCAYRELFEVALPSDKAVLHDLRDAPRPFVIELPLDQRRQYAAGDVLEANILLFGQGINLLAHVILAFADVARTGLGRYQVQARLEQVEALAYGQPFGVPIYRDGERLFSAHALPIFNLAELRLRATRQSPRVRLVLRTPLRIKTRGSLMERFEMPALVQAIAWRLHALNYCYGSEPWNVDYRPVIDEARQITIAHDTTHWVDWERSSTRPGKRQSMILGGLIGSVTLHDVPPAVQSLLLAASVVHVGKACVFGHGQLELDHAL